MRAILSPFFITVATPSLALALTLSACSDREQTRTAENIAAGVIISDARVRAPLPGQNIAVAYFTLGSANGDRLLAVSSPISERAELHTHIDNNGIIRMRPVNGGIDIPAGKSVTFKQGGLHVMLFESAIAQDMQDVSLTFDFETSDDVTIIADIMTHASYGSGDHNTEGHGSGAAKGEDNKSYGSGH